MLLLASAIRRLRTRDTGAQITLIGRDDKAKQGHSYASRMGLWWMLGADAGPPSPSRHASGATIPITRIDYRSLFQECGGVDPIRGGAVSRAAASAATTLCGSDADTPLWNALEYALREMVRNAFEHGRTDSVWYTASTRPRKDDVQLAILDEGRGIRSSLEQDANYRFSTDAEAIERALEPGVSCKSGRTRTPEQDARLREQHPGQDPTEWDNSGYGLTNTTKLCALAGQYSVVSGSASVSFIGASVTGVAHHVGTALRFVIHPSRLPSALEEIGLAGPNRHQSPSQSLMSASQRLRWRKRKP